MMDFHAAMATFAKTCMPVLTLVEISYCMKLLCCLQEAPPAVTNAHLRAAFDSARPSVSAQEAARLRSLYGRFRQSRDPGWGGLHASAGQRVTLA